MKLWMQKTEIRNKKVFDKTWMNSVIKGKAGRRDVCPLGGARGVDSVNRK